MALTEPVSTDGRKNIETVKRVFDAFARRDIDGALAFIHPQVRLWVITGTVTRGGRPYVGHAGIRQYAQDAERVWEELELLPLRFDEIDQAIVVLGEVRAKGAAGALSQPTVWTWKFRHGAVTDC